MEKKHLILPDLKKKPHEIFPFLFPTKGVFEGFFFALE